MILLFLCIVALRTYLRSTVSIFDAAISDWCNCCWCISKCWLWMHSNVVNTRESDYDEYFVALGIDAQSPWKNKMKRYAAYECTYDAMWNTMEITHVSAECFFLATNESLFTIRTTIVYFIHLILLQIRSLCRMWNATTKHRTKMPKEQTLNTKILVKIGNARDSRVVLQ